MDKDKALNTVQQYILKGQTEKAIKELQKLIKASPKDIRSHLKLGDLYSKNGDHEKAIDEYLKAGELHEREDLNFRAIAMYKKVLSLDPKNIEAYHKIAELYVKEGYKGDARNYYKSILKMRPNEQKALNALKGLDEEPTPLREVVPKRTPSIEPFAPRYSPPEKQRVEEPIPNVPDSTDEIEPGISDKDSEMHYHLGVAYKEMDLFDYAISEFEQASLNPTKRFDSCMMLGNCYMEKGVYDKSIEHFRGASEVKGLSNDKLARLHYHLGLAYEADGMISEALDAYSLALKMDPSSSEARDKIGRLQQKKR